MTLEKKTQRVRELRERERERTICCCCCCCHFKEFSNFAEFSGFLFSTKCNFDIERHRCYDTQHTAISTGYLACTQPRQSSPVPSWSFCTIEWWWPHHRTTTRIGGTIFIIHFGTINRNALCKRKIDVGNND